MITVHLLAGPFPHREDAFLEKPRVKEVKPHDHEDLGSKLPVQITKGKRNRVDPKSHDSAVLRGLQRAKSLVPLLLFT